MIQDIMQRISYIANDIDSVKDHFAEVIKDKSIPLDDRWGLFKSAPDYLKEHSDWIEDFDQFNFEPTCDDYERHRKVDMVAVVERVEEDGLEWDEVLKEYKKPTIEQVEDTNKFKEHILSINLGSFIMDW